MSDNKSARGFTLIELLVVISIIGLLASIVLVALNSARAAGRDARRISDMHQIQVLLTEYYNDHSAYPSIPNNMGCSGLHTCFYDASSDSGGSYTSWSQILGPDLSPYTTVSGINSLEDPSQDASHFYAYMFLSNVSDFFSWGSLSSSCANHFLLVAWGMETKTAAYPANNIGCTVNDPNTGLPSTRALVYVLQ